tara:strand:- start:734 stop:1168 length:435 start_codon:yes stop_codon:yes gene_type:complete
LREQKLTIIDILLTSKIINKYRQIFKRLVWDCYIGINHPITISWKTLMINATEHPSYSHLAELNSEAVILPEFTQAYLGAGTNGSKSVAVYDFAQCIIQLVGQEDMKPSQAKEFLFLDVISQLESKNSPMFLMSHPIMEEVWFD